MLEERNSLLSIEDLVVSYYKKEILRGASLDVGEGEIVTVIGANGSGKSTLLKAVAGVVRSQSGRVVFDGHDITQNESHAMIKFGIGFLMQGGMIFPSLTVEEHLQLATQVGRSRLAERLPIVWRTFPQIKPFRHKRAGLLSGGERQMLALAMLLTGRARLWLLDEPSVGLDARNVHFVMDVIKQVNQEEKVSILLIEQNLAEGLRVADRVYVLKNGLAFVESSANELLAEGKLNTLLFS